ncbi:glycosyl transferase [Steroidobacter agaridevorans]|uniref:Glycosyl transferase n=1 Tax=Steroidobacter agaridevorans TaxID=2695856 RepID=A0A829YH49_9GAMM|nr:glycosyltransferase family 4 protein [Steroidobacter agaridevorans]GFE82151.1 glycosyl transferase [Steroidobacter agaridevorans]GFE85461.1 glycosyl transferase [Steroidobacter agaridevorans]
MNILYIWDADYPWDVRVEKICHALMAGGHELHVAARNLKKRPVYENIDGLHVHRIRSWSSDRFNYFASFPLFCSPVWKGFLDSIIRERGIDLIIVRDLPMAIAGISAGKRAGIPVILDMAEDYVALVRDIWHARKFQGLNLVVRNPYLAKLVERYTFKHIDRIMVVVEEAGDVVIRGGGKADKITLVGNTPDLKGIEGSPGAEPEETLQQIRNHYSVIYTGGIQMGRGLQVVFDAIPQIVRHIPDFKFVVIGDGYASETLKKMMREKGVEQHVSWLGWVKHTQLPKYLNACRVGIVPHFTSDHVNTTIPNKIFDYMGCGLPVLASDAKPMVRILEQEQCGRTFASGDALQLTKTLLAMRGREEELGANGRRAVLGKYNWHEDTKRLLHLVAGLASKRP